MSREKGLDAARYALIDTTGWHVDYDLCIWRSRSAKEQKRIGWAMAGILILTTIVLQEAHER